MGGFCTGGIGFGFQVFGFQRAARYRKASVPLANAVFKCYDISQEQAASIGEPLADALVEYLPEKWLTTVTQGADPFRCVFALYMVVAAVMGNEKAVVAQYQERLLSQNDQERVVQAQRNVGEVPSGPPTPEGAESPLETLVEATGRHSASILAAADASEVE